MLRFRVGILVNFSEWRLSILVWKPRFEGFASAMTPEAIKLSGVPYVHIRYKLQLSQLKTRIGDFAYSAPCAKS